MEGMKQRLQLLRKSLKLNQKELGECLGIRQTSVSQMETGDRAISDRNVQLICEKFNVSEEWLREGTGEMFKENNATEQIKRWVAGIFEEGSEFERRIIAALSRFTEKDWQLFEYLLTKIIAEDTRTEAAVPEIELTEAEINAAIARAKREKAAQLINGDDKKGEEYTQSSSAISA